MLGGEKENFNKGYFDRLGLVLKLNDKQVNKVYNRLFKWQPKAIQLINNSFLDLERKNDYKSLIKARIEIVTQNKI